MNKRFTMELVKDVRLQLLTNCPNVYFREAKEKEKAYPYIVFDVRPLVDRRMVLELDIWDIRERTVNSETVYGEAEIRNLGDDIEDFFDGMVLSLPQYIASFYTNNDMKGVLDENKDIKHLNMSFDIIYQS